MKNKKIFIAIAATITLFLSCSQNTADEPDTYTIGTITYNEGGVTYDVPAIKQQIVVIFDETVSSNEAHSIIKKCGGRIIKELPERQYYLVKTKSDDEAGFMQRLSQTAANAFVYPNAVEYIQATQPVAIDNFKHIIKDFNLSHGTMVSSVMKECGSSSPIHDISAGPEDFGIVIHNNAIIEIDSLLTHTDGPVVINMSFGPSIDKEHHRWNNKSVTEKVKKNYRYNYYKSLESLLQFYGKYNDKDYVVVKAAGNDEVPNFEKEIIDYAYDRLTPKERETFDKHFILVTAQDTRDTYSNLLTPGVHHPWATMIDIDDLYSSNHLAMTGTSFAAPRAACFISKISDKYGMKATDVLKYARLATKNHSQHLLTLDNLDKTADIGDALGNTDYEFYHTFIINYTEDLFEGDGKKGAVILPNGDILNYRYVMDMDFLTYSVKFTLDDGNITDKYSIILINQLPLESAYEGAEHETDFFSDENYINVMISALGFKPVDKEKLVVIVSKK